MENNEKLESVERLEKMEVFVLVPPENEKIG